MKQICALVLATLLCVIATPQARAEDPVEVIDVVKEYTQGITVHTMFDAYGNAVYSENSTDTVTITEDKDGIRTRTIETTIVETTWVAGTLKTEKITSKTETYLLGDDGEVLMSKREYTDTYTYDSAGALESVSGSGTMQSTDLDTGHTRSGTITREFDVRDGQALLTDSITKGDIYAKDGGSIGDFISHTHIDASAGYAYKGGSWVVMMQASTNTTTWDNGNWEKIARVTFFERNDQGVMTGISQVAANGTKVVVKGDGAAGSGGLAVGRYTLSNYSTTAAFDSQMGWYIQEESYVWNLD